MINAVGREIPEELLVNGKVVDAAFIPGAERTLRLAKACGMYGGDLV